MRDDDQIELSVEISKLIVYRPVRTYNTAVVYYLKYRLAHPDNNGFIVSLSPPISLSLLLAITYSPVSGCLL